jgi:RimJ/RimL family protein N-acetyltransferase
VQRQTITAGEFALRPFAADDIRWVYELSLDPAVQKYVARARGIATDSVRVLCRWAFDVLGLDLIEWRAEVGNLASRRVAEKAGFRVEAVLRQRLVHRGMRVDAWVGSMLPAEMPTRPSRPGGTESRRTI